MPFCFNYSASKYGGRFSQDEASNHGTDSINSQSVFKVKEWREQIQMQFMFDTSGL